VDFVLGLHSHLPYVLNHGRWPHGSDWLCEAALDTYLPLLEELQGLQAEGVRAPVTIGFTPVLANQLVSPVFRREMDAFLAQRLAACEAAPASLATTGDQALVPLVGFWTTRFRRLEALFRAIDGDLVAAFRSLEASGALEIIGSAATHGYLPLLRRDESIRLQLEVGRAEHRRLFGRDPRGCWLPECAYRPGRTSPRRPGIERYLADAGFRYFFTDSHLARAGAALGAYGEVPLGTERFDVERHDASTSTGEAARRSPNRSYRVTPAGPRSVATLVRDPRASMQIWSRQQGYPGDEAYLEFHKIRWPGGLKFWRVSGGDVDLGGKAAYDPARAAWRAEEHARHFVGLLAQEGPAPGVIAAPFDTELFGHWWFEGVSFLGTVYRDLARNPVVRPVSASEHLAASPPTSGIRLAEGSWGANGDHSMWMNDQTAWTWQRLWPLEEAFWRVAPKALATPAAHPVLAQAARQLLLAQASDWQFIISTGAATDYGEQRFTRHCEDAEQLVRALETDWAVGSALAAALDQRDQVFPDVVASLAGVLAG
jgi:1,4-alpha-glucan branching enzyme